MNFYSLILSLDSQFCTRQTVQVEKSLRLTKAILDIKSLSCNGPDTVYTLRMKSPTDDQEIIICQLYNGFKHIKYQTKIDIRLNSGSTVTFSCAQTCNIHLTGYYLDSE